jgi:putative sterol carrier protein
MNKDILETSKQLAGHIKHFDELGIKVIDVSISDNKTWVYANFDYAFVKTMLRGNYEVVEEVAWGKITFKKDNLFVTAYQ